MSGDLCQGGDLQVEAERREKTCCRFFWALPRREGQPLIEYENQMNVIAGNAHNDIKGIATKVRPNAHGRQGEKPLEKQRKSDMSG